jgi:hypothetical protein
LKISRIKPKKLGENPVTVSLHPLWIPYEVTWDWTRGSIIRKQCLTIWAMAWPTKHQLFQLSLHCMHSVNTDLEPCMCVPAQFHLPYQLINLVGIYDGGQGNLIFILIVCISYRHNVQLEQSYNSVKCDKIVIFKRFF